MAPGVVGMPSGTTGMPSGTLGMASGAFRPPSERSDPGRNEVFASLYLLQSVYLQQFESNSASKGKNQ